MLADFVGAGLLWRISRKVRHPHSVPSTGNDDELLVSGIVSRAVYAEIPCGQVEVGLNNVLGLAEVSSDRGAM